MGGIVLLQEKVEGPGLGLGRGPRVQPRQCLAGYRTGAKEVLILFGPAFFSVKWV